MEQIPDRRALYYPHIHIRDSDINWLKATLLCFGQVGRIVPYDFIPNDSLRVRSFTKVKGLNDQPLLMAEYTDRFWEDDGPVYLAQKLILETLRAHEEPILARYSRAAAQRDFPNDPDSFEMHTGKLLENLRNYLLAGFDAGRDAASQLGWDARRQQGYLGGEWVSLHPRLGEAIMSIIAIAVARASDRDIVTNNKKVHHALVVQDVNEVLDALVGRYPSPKTPDIGQQVDDLAEVVMTTAFDLDRLEAWQIAELIKDGKDLRAFKNGLKDVARALTDPTDPGRREEQLREKAREVIAAWEKHRKSLPGFAVDALLEGPKALEIPAFALDLAAGHAVLSAAPLPIGAVAIPATPITLAAGAGLTVGLLAYRGQRIWRQYRAATDDPVFNYLSHIERAGASLVLPVST